ncbi:MAG: EamA family transporter RarD [Pacificimonas sp.]
MTLGDQAATAAAEKRAGLFAALGAYLLWGMMPVYLKLFDGMSAAAVLAHRVLWSAVLLMLVVIAIRKGAALTAALSNPRLMGWLIFSALMIGANWYIYTWAVLNARVLDASLGYFIQPIINTALGVVLLKERLTAWQWLAVGLALTGIAIMTAAMGSLPLVSLGLAGAFALYALARNRAAVDAITGLLIETAILAPVALWWLMARAGGVFAQPLDLMLLLMLSSVVTSVPLALYGHAARRLTLSALGFLQYIAPTCVFLLGVFAYGEAMDVGRLTAFAFIWAGLAAFSIGGFRGRRGRAKG